LFFGLQAAVALRARDVHQRHVVVQGVHHGPRLGHQVQPGLQPLLVLQGSRRQAVPRAQPKADGHRPRCESPPPLCRVPGLRDDRCYYYYSYYNHNYYYIVFPNHFNCMISFR